MDEHKCKWRKRKSFDLAVILKIHLNLGALRQLTADIAYENMTRRSACEVGSSSALQARRRVFRVLPTIKIFNEKAFGETTVAKFTPTDLPTR